jgi:uncharacterized membrane protein YciS (DUF1049 family)
MRRYAFLIATVVGMGLVMLFLGRVGYWIEAKLKARQLRRRKEDPQ